MVSALASINLVNRHWARLLLGRATAQGQINHITSHLGLLSLLPSVGWQREYRYQLSGWKIINGDGGCGFLAAYRRATGSSPSAWSKGRQPSGAVLHSSREPGVWRPCSDFMDVLRRLKNCGIICCLLFFTVVRYLMVNKVVYRVGQKKRGQIIFAITLSTASQFS